MPSAQLTPTQLTDLSQLLHHRHRDLSLAVERELHADGTTEMSVATTSDADWKAADVEADTFIAKAARDSIELSEVTEALDRLTDGRYGNCETCSKDIGYSRLLVHPAARRCLPCQKAAEDKGDSSHGSSRRPR